MKLKSDLFLKVIEDQVVLWDYRAHRQFILNEQQMQAFYAIATKKVDLELDEDLQKNLLEAGILIEDDLTEATPWGWDPLSKIFHIGTQNLPQDSNEISRKDLIEEYLAHSTEIDDISQPDPKEISGATLKLPDFDPEALVQRDLLQVLFSRKTNREFTPEIVKKQNLANILYLTFGFVHNSDPHLLNLDIKQPRRKISASGGNIHGVEAYVVASRVEGVAPGIYHYSSTKHHLTEVSNNLDDVEMTKILAGQFYSEGLGFGVILTCQFDRYWWKYKHSRAYRVALMDVGHVSQTFQIATTAHGLQTWITGAFNDDKISKILDINNREEGPMFFLGAGRGNGHSIPREFRDRLVKT